MKSLNDDIFMYYFLLFYVHNYFLLLALLTSFIVIFLHSLIFMIFMDLFQVPTQPVEMPKSFMEEVEQQVGQTCISLSSNLNDLFHIKHWLYIIFGLFSYSKARVGKCIKCFNLFVSCYSFQKRFHIFPISI